MSLWGALMTVAQRGALLDAARATGTLSTSTRDFFDIEGLVRRMNWPDYFVAAIRDAPFAWQEALHAEYLRGVDQADARRTERAAEQELAAFAELISVARLDLMLSPEQRNELAMLNHVTEQSAHTGKWFRFHRRWSHSLQILRALDGPDVKGPSAYPVRLQLCIAPSIVARSRTVSYIRDHDIITSFLASLRAGDEVRLLAQGVLEHGYLLNEEQAAVAEWAYEESIRRDNAAREAARRRLTDDDNSPRRAPYRSYRSSNLNT